MGTKWLKYQGNFPNKRTWCKTGVYSKKEIGANKSDQMFSCFKRNQMLGQVCTWFDRIGQAAYFVCIYYIVL
jgi:hypothetical protein